MNITSLALRRPVTIVMVYTCLAVIGLIASRLLPIEYFPAIDFPGVLIEVPYRNSTPEEVERNITRPIEEALATLGDIKRMISESRENGAFVFVFFGWGTDVTIKGVEARDKVDAIRHNLPADIQRVLIRKFSTNDAPVLTLRISSKRDLSNAYDMLEHNLKNRIEGLEGVSKVELYGVTKKQIRIELNASRISSHGIDLNALLEKLRQANFSITGGKFTDTGRRYLVHPVGEYQDIRDIGEQVINEKGLRLKDVADIRYDYPVLAYGRHLDQRYAIGLNVFMETGQNIVAVSQRALDEIDAVSQLPEMQGITLYAMDNQGEGIKQSLSDLVMSGLVGALFSVMVLYFFLRHITMTLIVTLAVPFSILITLAVMYFAGFSMNILTMMGLMLSVGMLVDNAVVITENIFRYQQLMPGKNHQATLAGVKEVSTAVFTGTMTTAIVFLPNIFGVQNNITIFLSHVAITICLALFASLAISKTLIPLLTTRIRVNPISKQGGMMSRLAENYSRILVWTLSHRKWTVLMIVLILFSVVIPLNAVKKEMFPDDEGRRLFLQYNLNGQYALDKVEQTVSQVEKYLFDNQQKFEIKSVYSYFDIGRAESTILLQEDELAVKPTTEIKKLIKEGLPKIAIGNPSFQQRRAGANDVLSMQVYGDAMDEVWILARDVERILAASPDFTDVRIDAGPGDWEVSVIIDRQRVQQYGLSSQYVANAVSIAMRGQRLRNYRGETGEIEMLVQFAGKDRANIDRLFQVPIRTPSGEQVTLASLARWEINDVSGMIRRENRLTGLSIQMGLNEITSDKAKTRLKNIMDQVAFPPGYGWQLGQGFQEQDESQVTMLVNMLLAIVLIYIVMAALFESLLYPASIITSIVFSIIGVFWFFLITGTTFSLMAMIGILVLMGVVVNNGIVLVDHINHLRSQQLSREEAILQAGKDRLRPILMTVSTTVLGLIPLSVGDAALGGDGPPYFPMARAIIGGLVFSTVISLVVLPTIYSMLDDLGHWAKRVWALSTPTAKHTDSSAS